MLDSELHIKWRRRCSDRWSSKQTYCFKWRSSAIQHWQHQCCRVSLLVQSQGNSEWGNSKRWQTNQSCRRLLRRTNNDRHSGHSEQWHFHQGKFWRRRKFEDFASSTSIGIRSLDEVVSTQQHSQVDFGHHWLPTFLSQRSNIKLSFCLRNSIIFDRTWNCISLNHRPLPWSLSHYSSQQVCLFERFRIFIRLNS